MFRHVLTVAAVEHPLTMERMPDYSGVMAKKSDLTFQERWDQIHHSGSDMALTLGIEPIDESDDSVTLRLPHSPKVRQPTGLFSAASLFGLADVAGTLLAMNHTTGDGFPLAVQSNINLLSNTSEGAAIAIAKLVKVGQTLIVTETQVQSDRGKLLANVTTTYIQPRD